MAKKMDNFQIKNYIHLSYENAKEDSNITSSSFNRSTDLLSVKERQMKRLEKEFMSVTGMSSKVFASKMSGQLDMIEAINALFEADTMADIKKITGDEKLIAQMDAAGMSSKQILAAGEMVATTNILTKATFNRGSAAKTIDAIKDAFVGVDLYEQFINELAAAPNQNSREFNKVIDQYVVHIMDDVASKTRNIIDNASELKGTYNLKSPVLDEMQKNIKNMQEAIASNTASRADVDKFVRSTRMLINTDLKGRLIGELASGEQSKGLLDMIFNSFSGSFESSIKHAGKDVQSTSGGSIGIGSKNTISSVVSEAVKDFTTKDMRADIIIESGSKKIPISRKTYNRASSFPVSLATQSIGQLLTYMDSTDSENLLNKGSSTDAAFFSSLSYYLLDGDFNKETVGGVSKVLRKSEQTHSANVIDSAFGGVLSEFAMAAMSSVLSARTVAFMDINGLLIPSPMYYKMMMDKFISGNANRIYASSYIKFNQSIGKKALEKIMTDPKTDAHPAKTKKGKLNYSPPAYFRNIGLRSSILDHKITVRSDFLSMDDYRRQILATKGG